MTIWETILNTFDQARETGADPFDALDEARVDQALHNAKLNARHTNAAIALIKKETNDQDIVAFLDRMVIIEDDPSALKLYLLKTNPGKTADEIVDLMIEQDPADDTIEQRMARIHTLLGNKAPNEGYNNES